MKRIGSMLAVAALAIAVIVASLMPAEATHTEAHLRRQINRLENQVSSLQSNVNALNRDVNDLLHDVFDCQILVDPPEQFDDGLFYHDLYYSASCAGATSAREVRR
jgi:outer membrane murein-binding lipoprotein Lpp